MLMKFMGPGGHILTSVIWRVSDYNIFLKMNGLEYITLGMNELVRIYVKKYIHKTAEIHK